MPRKEASLEGRPEHLRALAEALRAARSEAGLTLKQLSKITSYTESALSRATSALSLPSWELVEGFLRGCGVVDIPTWQHSWENTRRRHAAFQNKGVKKPPATTLRPAASRPAPTAPPEHVEVDRPRTLTGLLKQAETPLDLGVAITMLGERAGATSLRQMQLRSGIPKSTIGDWKAGERRPNKLDELVTALGATPSEQREFAQCLARVWSQNPPVLKLKDRPVYTRLGTERGGHCCLVTVTVYDRNVTSGLVWIAAPPQDVIGVSIGPDHPKAGQIALVPKVSRRGSFTVGIWVTSPLNVAGLKVVLAVKLETADKSTWTDQLQVTLPTSIQQTPHHLVMAADRSGTAVVRPPIPPRVAAQAARLSRAKASNADPGGASLRVRAVDEAPQPESAGKNGGYRARHRKKGKPRGPFRRRRSAGDDLPG